MKTIYEVTDFFMIFKKMFTNAFSNAVCLKTAYQGTDILWFL